MLMAHTRRRDTRDDGGGRSFLSGAGRAHRRIAARPEYDAAAARRCAGSFAENRWSLRGWPYPASGAHAAAIGGMPWRSDFRAVRFSEEEGHQAEALPAILRQRLRRASPTY